MVRRSFWFFALVLLAACARTSDPSAEPDAAPPIPTTMSTELADGARRVIAAADNGAYVLGYRRESTEPGSPEIYVSHFDAVGCSGSRFCRKTTGWRAVSSQGSAAC